MLARTIEGARASFSATNLTDASEKDSGASLARRGPTSGSIHPRRILVAFVRFVRFLAFFLIGDDRHAWMRCGFVHIMLLKSAGSDEKRLARRHRT
jgi:hypothetical protein